MCGIAGILDWKGAPADRLDPMLKAIVHRGPDDEGTFVEGPIAMGMRRLSIIDLNSGHQPIFNEDESVVVVFNGEIYNYVELRADLEKRGHTFRTNSDTEVLVHLYEDEGLDFLPRLNGMFGFTIWDRKRRRLFMVRDRVGIKPMYYTETENGLLYGTELKSILATGLISPSINPAAIFDYLTHFYMPGTRSPFQDVHKLLPGHYLVADENGIDTKCWWDLRDYTATEDIGREDATARIRELFLDSVRLRMRSDVPVGSYLSGGLDSSLVTAAAASQTDLDFATFAVGFSDSEFNELPYAKAVAEHTGTNHHEIQVSPSDALEHFPNLIWHMDEPNGDAAILPTYLVSELAVRHVKVSLSGIGADEFFGGYHRYHHQIEKLGRLAVLPQGLLRVIRPLLAAMRYDWGYRLDRIIEPPHPWIQHLEQTHRYDEESIKLLLGDGMGELGDYTRSSFERYPGNDYVNHRMFADAHGYLPDQILALTDRMSMAVSLEARAPFLDYRLMEFATGLPGEWKVDGKEWKLILKNALGDLVPQRTIQRPKWGFAPPVRTWMNDKQLDAFVHLLRNSHLARDGYLDGGELKRQIADPSAFQNKGEWLWALSVLELWYRVYEPGGSMARPDVSLGDFARAD
jgi:asparagine synthase (glutamine-hydrolysing)